MTRSRWYCSIRGVLAGRVPIAAAMVLGALTLAPAATAGDIDTVATYVARLSGQDHVSSTGQRLTSAAAIIQQDRANYHRFGKRDTEDEGDPIFADPEVRAGIAAAIARGCCPFDPVEEAVIVGDTPLIEGFVSWDGKKHFMTVQIVGR